MDKTVLSGNPRVVEFLRARQQRGYRPGRDDDGTKVIVAFTGDAMRAPRSIASAMALEAYTGRSADIVAGNSSGSAVASNMVSGTLAKNVRMFFAPEGVARLNDDAHFIEPGLFSPTMHNRFLTGPVMGPGGSFALDAKAMAQSGQRLILGVSDAKTLQPISYSFQGADFANQKRLMEVIAASTHIPGVSGNLPVLDGRRVFDGAFTDPIPYAAALEQAVKDGAKNVKLLVISSQHPKDMDDLNFMLKAIVSLAGSVAVENPAYRTKFYERYDHLRRLGQKGSPLLEGTLQHRLPDGRVMNIDVATLTSPAGTPKADPMTRDGETLKAMTKESFRWASQGIGEALKIPPQLRPTYNPDKDSVPHIDPALKAAPHAYQGYGADDFRTRHGTEPRPTLRAETVVVGQPAKGRVITGPASRPAGPVPRAAGESAQPGG